MVSLPSVTKVAICRIWSTHTLIFWKPICLTCLVLAEFLFKAYSLLEPEVKAEDTSPETRVGGSAESHLTLFRMALVALQLLPAETQTFPKPPPCSSDGSGAFPLPLVPASFPGTLWALLPPRRAPLPPRRALPPQLTGRLLGPALPHSPCVKICTHKG